ncbi:MAG: hypothetical protein KC502_01845 [Myxococcales bacterium]|nr:hypothetical protein [Myxococcales bacterium]
MVQHAAMLTASRILLAAVLTLVCGCQPDIPAVSGRTSAPDATAVVDGASVDTSGASAGWDGWPGDDTPPTIELSTVPATSTTAASIVVQGKVSDDTGLAAATLQVGVNVPVPLHFDPTTGAFSQTVLLPHGAHTLSVKAWDIGGKHATAQAKIARTGAPTDKEAPKLTVAAPKKGFVVTGNTVWVVGKASDDVAVTDVTVQVGSAQPVRAETSDFFGHYQLAAAIGAGGQVQVTVRAFDAAGNSTQVIVKGETTLQVDTVPPSLEISTPTDGFKTDVGAVMLNGKASDDSGIKAVQVRVGAGPYLAAASSDGFKTFSLPLVLKVGPNTIKVRALDGAGLVTTRSIVVHETSGQSWSAPITVPLRLQPKQTASSTFELDRAGLTALLPPDKAAKIVALKMSVAKLIAATLNKIRNACGSGWQKPNNLSKYCPKGWGQAEINLWRLVTMTPSNVNVKGTSIEGMSDIAKTLSQWGLMDSFSEILAITLGIAETDLIVNAQAVADSMIANVIGSHPNATKTGEITVTLEDCLTDLKTLTKRYGPAGLHPGFLDPSAPPVGVMLTPEFTMKMVATSNLHWHDALQLGKGKGYLALVRDVIGPTYNDVLEFNFLSSKTYQIDGLALNPTVDLAFSVQESNQWIDIGTSMHPIPKGNSKAWNLQPWTLEHALIDASYRGYKNRRAGCDMCKGKSSGALLWEVPIIGLDEAELVVGRQGYSKGGWSPENFSKISPNPAGWLRIWTLFGLGKPPKPQYVWDMLLGVSQRRLLDGGVAQGKGSVRFVLKDVPVGITAQELKDALAPSLESQKGKLANVLMGDWQSKQPVDVFLAKGSQGKRWLMFVSGDDPLPKGSANHPKRGFFADAKLTKKLSASSSQGSGDAVHEKLPWPATPKTVYCSDVQGKVHRLRLDPQPDGTLWVTMRKWIGAGAP